MLQGTRIIETVESAYANPLLLKQLLHTPIIYSPDQEIVYRDTKRFTYREFYSRMRRLASGMQALGIKPGDIVAFLDWDSYRYLEAYFSIPGIGAVLHCVNVRLSPDQILFTMNHAEDTVVFVHEDFIPLIEPIIDRLPSVRTWVLMKETDRDIDCSIPFECEYEDVLGKGTDDFAFPDFDENSQATLFYTTGTTGDPKGVYFSHRQLVLHTLGVLVTNGALSPNRLASSRDVYMPITPMFHVHAWGVPFASTVLGIKQVYPGRYEPEMLLRLLIGEKVTFSHCVPTILQMLVNSPIAKQIDLTGWKVTIGGSALPRGLAKAAMELGIEVYCGYGMSETCPLLTMAILPPDKVEADIDEQVDIRTTAGRPAPLVDLRVVDPDMNEVPRDGQTTGEIVVRSPWLTQGYFKNPEKGRELWEGGYLHTGDVAYMDKDGYVHITDRIKDVIKTGGEWVSSLQIESLISQHPAVNEVAVVGVPDEKWGERPLAMVVPTSGETENFPNDDVREFLMKFVEDGTISKYAVPDHFVVVSEIPKTSVGKHDKKLIRQQV
jgi:fatty-acyl-CoA synthase